MGQRYTVLPLQAPHLEGNNSGFGRRFGRNFRGGKGYKSEYPQDKQKENKIKEDVEQVLLNKFENTNQWTEGQKKGIKNTLKAQVGVYADMILEQAEEECYNTLPDIDESISAEEEQKFFYKKLYDIAIDIAEKKFDIDQEFDIEEAINREKSVLEKIQKGELTPYAAKSYLEEPLLYKGEINNKYKQYVNLYNSFTTKGRENIKNKEKETNKETSKTRTKEESTSKQREQSQTESQQRTTQSKDEKEEYLNIKTVRRDAREEAGLIKGSFINLGVGVQKLILKIYEKIPKVFRDAVEELGKNGFSKKWKYLVTGAVISSKLDDSREKKMRKERMNFHDRVYVPNYDDHHCGPHHHEPHHDEHHHCGPHHDEPYHDDR